MQPFVLMLQDIEHVHFERVTCMTKEMDCVFIFKKGIAKHGSAEFIRIDSIPMQELEGIQQWLDTVCDLTYTCGVMPLKWDLTISKFVRDPYFYLPEDEHGQKKEYPGWSFLMDSSDGESETDKEYESSFSEKTQEDDYEYGMSSLFSFPLYRSY